MNSLISTSMFYHSEREVSFKQIKTNSFMLYNYIQDRNYKNYISAPPSHYEINLAALNLGFKVKGKPLHKKEGGNAIIDMRQNNGLLK